MKQLLLLITISMLASCAYKRHVYVGKPGTPGSSCSVTSVSGGALITCTDGTSSFVSDGTSGADGSDGLPGIAGSNCSVAQLTTGAVITCENGTSAYISNGVQGPAGADAPPSSSVVVINLCNDTTSYPTVFSEVGLCINNQLYAVYSTNGGFMSLIPPGNYVSHGHGSSCNLTVAANCAVTH